jgi:hypothetical protein
MRFYFDDHVRRYGKMDCRHRPSDAAIAARFRPSGLPTGRADAEGAVKGRPNRPDVSPEDAKAKQAFLPIGPSCC